MSSNKNHTSNSEQSAQSGEHTEETLVEQPAQPEPPVISKGNNRPLMSLHHQHGVPPKVTTDMGMNTRNKSW